MKTKFNLSQFFIQNEPKLAALIGNIALICATISGLILGIPAAMTAAGVQNFTLPAEVTHIASVLLIISVLCKSITKMFGTVDDSGKPVNTTIPPATN